MKKIVTLTLMLLVCATTFPAQQLNKGNQLINGAIVSFFAGLGGYVLYEMGKSEGFWGYPSAEELFVEIDAMQEQFNNRQELIDAFVSAEDTAKEEVLYMAANAPGTMEKVHALLSANIRLIRKINGRMWKMLSEDPDNTDIILTLSRRAAILRSQAQMLTDLSNHVRKHAPYFKLFAAEQSFLNCCGREFYLYERYSDDVEHLQAELLTYGTYKVGDQFSLLTTRERISAVCKECYATISLSEHYSHLKQRLQTISDTLQKINSLIVSTDEYIKLEQLYEKLASRPDDA